MSVSWYLLAKESACLRQIIFNIGLADDAYHDENEEQESHDEEDVGGEEQNRAGPSHKKRTKASTMPLPFSKPKTSWSSTRWSGV